MSFPLINGIREEMKRMGLPIKKADCVYTYDDYRSWPEDERWELIEGVAWNMSAAPSRWHQGLVTRFFDQILPHLRNKQCEMFTAPFDVLLPEAGESMEDEISTVVQPDISVICDTKKLTEKGCTGAPDWIIEIISPATAAKDFDEKLHLYERHSVREYWVVDPGNKAVYVFVLDPKGDTYGEPKVFVRGEKPSTIYCFVLEGLEIDTAKLFS